MMVVKYGNELIVQRLINVGNKTNATII
jgi:hypothetical protein